MKTYLLKYLAICLIGSITLICRGQDLEQVDSLQIELLKTSDPELKFNILKSLYKAYEGMDLNHALLVSKEMLNLSLKMDNHLAVSYSTVGSAFYNLDMWDSSMFYYQQAPEYVKNTMDSTALSIAYTNMGIIKYMLGEQTEGLELMIKSAEIDRRLGDLSGAALGYSNAGAGYAYIKDSISEMQNLAIAEKYLHTAESIAIEIGDSVRLGAVYTNLGYVGLSRQDYNLATTYNLKSVEIAKAMQDQYNLSNAYRNLAEVYVKKGLYKIAIEYDKLGLNAAMGDNNPDLIKHAYYCLSISYEKQGNFRDAYEYHKLYSDWSDSVLVRNNRETILEIEKKYNTEQTEKENEILTQQSQIKDLEIAKGNEELEKSKIIIWSSIVGLLMLVVLAFTLFNRNRIKQRANLELQLANDIIREKNKDITDSLEYASKIQEALLPNKLNMNMFDDSFILLKPKDIVSGDFYWYTKAQGRKIIAVVDCTGHGVPGAFMSMIGNTFLHEIVVEKGIVNPGKILNELRTKVIRALNQEGVEESRRDGMDMAICAIDEQSMTMEYAGANNPVYIAQNSEMLEIKGDKQPVGYMPEKAEDFRNHSIKISKGDCIYIFSDGYADQFGGPKGKKFKYKQLRELLLKNAGEDMAQQKAILDRTFENWKGELEQIDDVCIMGVRI